MLPVKPKPSVNYKEYHTMITEVPNVLPVEQIERLKVYANSDISGLHRRGSKDKNTDASFYTCQVYKIDDPVYEILNPLWKKHIDTINSNIEFIEPYEIKSYVVEDQFDYHTDVYVNLEQEVDRKLNMIIQLSDSDEYEGGDLMIGGFVATRQKGSVVFFPASFQHCVTKITSGTRYSLVGHGWGPYHI